MAGDGTFDDFYARHHRRVRAFAYTLRARDADDVAQEAMVRAWGAYGSLDAGRDPWPWLSTIVRNVVRDRASRPEPVPVEDVPAVVPDTTGTVAERLLLGAALRRLSSADRRMLELRECQEWTFDELSALYGRSPNVLRQQAFRARRRLAHAYTALGGRAGAVLVALRRWRVPAGAPEVAAAVLAGTLAVTAPGAGGGPVPDARPPATAGPAAPGDTTAGPAARRAAPVRPLQPARAARLVAPEASPARIATPASPRPSPTPVADVGDDRTGHSKDAALPDGDRLACALTPLC